MEGGRQRGVVSEEGRAGERENRGERKRERREDESGAQVKLSEDDGTEEKEGRGRGRGESGKWASLCKSSLSSEQIREAGSHCRGVGCL